MAQNQTPESTSIRAYYGLDSLFQGARHELFNRRGALFGTASKAGELALAPEIGSPGTVQRAEYVLAYDRTGKFLADASDVRLQTIDETGEGVTNLYVTLQGSELSEETIQVAIVMANEAVREGHYVHRAVLDTDAPLPGQLVPLPIAHPALAEVA